MSETALSLASLVLEDLHAEIGAKFAPFAGSNMPVQYGMGVMAEHLHCRAKAGLFDVSHMGQVLLYPKTTMADLTLALERLMPVDVLGLGLGRQRYGFLTQANGGILDDVMFSNRGDHIFIVVNAGRKTEDLAHFAAELSAQAFITPVTDRALLALQGPLAAKAMARIVPDIQSLYFMDCGVFNSDFGEIWVSRSGYTGEDGFEISVPNAGAAALAYALFAMPEVAPIGLGARDSLRLEAALCLYGHEIDTSISPIEAGLTWAISKQRRPNGARAGGYLGADAIEAQMRSGPTRKRVGLYPEGRAPMRDGTVLFSTSGVEVGRVTSGGFGPSLSAPIAMGLVDAAHSALGLDLLGEVRGKKLPVKICALPFFPNHFRKRSTT
jgi:aminomethyltransferase